MEHAVSRGVQLEWPGVPSAPIQTPSRVLWEEEAEADHADHTDAVRKS